jgi:KTSC domain
MEFIKIDLSNVLAITHDDDFLGLVIDRGDSIEVLEIPAPVAAFEGLRQLNAIVSDEDGALSETADFYQLPGVEPEIPMLPFQSTMANAVGYNPDHQILQIEFKNGSVYQYEDVDEETWEAMRDNASPGRFYNRQIKGHYPSRRLDEH